VLARFAFDELALADQRPRTSSRSPVVGNAAAALAKHAEGSDEWGSIAIGRVESRERVMTNLFRNRWWVVFATICGLLVGAGPINVFTFGVFLKPITEDLGLSRGAFSAA